MAKLNIKKKSPQGLIKKQVSETCRKLTISMHITVNSCLFSQTSFWIANAYIGSLHKIIECLSNLALSPPNNSKINSFSQFHVRVWWFLSASLREIVNNVSRNLRLSANWIYEKKLTQTRGNTLASWVKVIVPKLVSLPSTSHKSRGAPLRSYEESQTRAFVYKCIS